MLHLKQILHNLYTTISTTISTIATDLRSLGVVPQNLVSQENLGRLLLSLMLLVSIAVLMVANFILSLLWLLMTTLTKLQKLWTLTEVPGWNVRYILCRWADAVKNTPSTLKTWQKRVWKEDGDSRQDSTYHYSEMRGGRENEFDPDEFLEDEKVKQKAKTLEDRVREAGI